MAHYIGSEELKNIGKKYFTKSDFSKIEKNQNGGTYYPLPGSIYTTHDKNQNGGTDFPLPGSMYTHNENQKGGTDFPSPGSMYTNDKNENGGTNFPLTGSSMYTNEKYTPLESTKGTRLSDKETTLLYEKGHHGTNNESAIGSFGLNDIDEKFKTGETEIRSSQIIDNTDVTYTKNEFDRQRSQRLYSRNKSNTTNDLPNEWLREDNIFNKEDNDESSKVPSERLTREQINLKINMKTGITDTNKRGLRSGNEYKPKDWDRRDYYNRGTPCNTYVSTNGKSYVVSPHLETGMDDRRGFHFQSLTPTRREFVNYQNFTSLRGKQSWKTKRDLNANSDKGKYDQKDQISSKEQNATMPHKPNKVENTRPNITAPCIKMQTMKEKIELSLEEENEGKLSSLTSNVSSRSIADLSLLFASNISSLGSSLKSINSMKRKSEMNKTSISDKGNEQFLSVPSIRHNLSETIMAPSPQTTHRF